MSKQDTRPFRVIAVLLLTGILCMLILLYNRSVTANPKPIYQPQIQQQTEQDQEPSDEPTPNVQSI